MRVIAIAILSLAIFCSALAEDLDQLTLRDGRKLTGHYDEVRGVLVMESPHAEMPVDKRDIVSREMVEPPPAAAPKNKADPAAQAFPASVPPGDTDDLRATDAKVSDLHAQAAALERQAVQVKIDFCRRWLLAANLDPAVRPKMDADPTKSQMERDQIISDLNGRLEGLTRIRRELSAKNAEHFFEQNSDYKVVDDFFHGKEYAIYQETRAPGKHESAPPTATAPSEPRQKNPKR